MIKINLVPRKAGRPVLRFDLYLLMGVCFLNFAVLMGIYWVNMSRISADRSGIESAKREIASLDPVYKEYLRIETEKKEIERRLKVMENLKEGRALAARTLYDLAGTVKERVWVKTFKKAEDSFEIEGRSLENESISDFIEGVSAIPYFRNVELKRVEDVNEDGLILKKFIVQGNITL
jgi:type IV pilus assembly protein PilN